MIKNKVTFIFMRYLSIMVLLAFFSCKERQEFKQPQVLTKYAAFDIAKLSFDEDVQRLLSQSLDTINNDYTINDFSSALYPTKESRENIISQKGLTYLDEGRYHLESLILDSIAQFHGLYTDKIYIETDTSLGIRACWATARLYDTLQVNNVLHKMYLTYGKTTVMKRYQKELGIQEVVSVSTDKNGERISKITEKEYNIDYESYLYEYILTPDDDYQEWVLEDRVIQIKLSDGFESEIDGYTGNIKRQKYLDIQFLVLTKKEYDLISENVRTASTENNYPMRVMLSYYIDELDLYKHFEKYYIRESEKGVKVYDFYK